VIVKLPGTRNCVGTVDLPSNWIKVVKGASADACEELSAFCEVFLSIATSAARRSIAHRVIGFPPDCISIREAAAKHVRVSYKCPLVSAATAVEVLRARSGE
jgi:hypothetical protein